MIWLRRFLAWLLGLVLALTVWGYVTDASIFNSAFIVRQADSSNIDTTLAKVMPQLLTQTGVVASSDLSLVTPLITPQLVKLQLDQAITQLELYYHQGGPKPKLDLSAQPRLAALVQVQPTLSAGSLDGGLSWIVQWSARLKWLGPLAAIILLALGWLLARGTRLSFLAEAVAITAAGCLVEAGLIQGLPRSVISTISSSMLRPLADPLSTLLNACILPPTRWLLWATGLSLGLSILLKLAQAAAHITGRFRRHQ